MQERFKVSVHRSCRLALLQRSSWYAKSEARDQSALRQRIRDIALSRPRFGYLRVLVMLKREGWPVGKTRVYRLYRLEGLQLRMKVKRRKRIALMRGKPQKPTGPNQHWSMDFVHDQTHDGRAFRILTVIDQWSRESVCLEANFRLSGRCLAQALDEVARHRGWPNAITVDIVLNARGVPRNGNSIACRSCRADRHKAKSDEQNQRRGSAAQGASVNHSGNKIHDAFVVIFTVPKTA
jgi:putative transposase